jgi:acyl-CoA thioester hydrolase
MLINRTEIRVRYADTDQMQFVYNGKYLEYFEAGRTEMLREIGLPYNVLEKKGYQLPVLEAHIKYHRPAFYDDIIIIKSVLKEFPSLKIHIDYELIRKETNEVIAEGYTIHIFMNQKTRKPVRPPDFFLGTVKRFFTD